MTDYTIEDVDRYLRNNMGDEDYELYSDAIEDMYALVEKQKADNLKMVGIINELEAKLAALEKQEPVGRIDECLPVSGYVDNPDGSSDWIYNKHYKALVYSDTPLNEGDHVYLAAGAQSPTALELMKSYSNGKQWALEAAAQICKDRINYGEAGALLCERAIREIGGING